MALIPRPTRSHCIKLAVSPSLDLQLNCSTFRIIVPVRRGATSPTAQVAYTHPGRIPVPPALTRPRDRGCGPPRRRSPQRATPRARDCHAAQNRARPGSDLHCIVARSTESPGHLRGHKEAAGASVASRRGRLPKDRNGTRSITEKFVKPPRFTVTLEDKGCRISGVLDRYLTSAMPPIAALKRTSREVRVGPDSDIGGTRERISDSSRPRSDRVGLERAM